MIKLREAKKGFVLVLQKVDLYLAQIAETHRIDVSTANRHGESPATLARDRSAATPA